MEYTGMELIGERVCLRCKHLYRKTEDETKKICQCKNPILAPAELVHFDSIVRISQYPQYRKLLSTG